jgi:hypothetical protein
METHGFKYHDYKFELTDEQLKKSPYLKALTETKLGVEKDKDHNIILLFDEEPSTVKHYVDYLMGKRTFINKQIDKDFFDFMGTSTNDITITYGFVYHKYRFNLTDEQLNKSPYLKSLTETGLGVETDDDDYIILLLDVGPATLQNYVNYLMGNTFFLSKEVDLDFFDFMGTDNVYEYGPEYWKYILEGNTHSKCGDMAGKVTSVKVKNYLLFWDLHLETLNVKLYYVGDTALLSAGIISKPSVLTIIFDLKDKDVLMKHLNHKTDKNNMIQVSTLHAIEEDTTNAPYKTYRPLLRSDSLTLRAKHPYAIWNDDKFKVVFMGRNFKCMEELLYLYQADTDGIAMEVVEGKVIKTMTTVTSYRSYMNRTVNLKPDYIHSRFYLDRLCNLSLMGFKINVPLFNSITSIDDHKTNIFKTRIGIPEIKPFSVYATFNNSREHEKEYGFILSDYISLLTIGPTRYSSFKFNIQMPVEPKKVDLDVLYRLSQFVDNNDLIRYQYDKHDLGDKTLEGMLYNFEHDHEFHEIYRLDFYDVTLKGKYVVGPVLCELMKYGTSTLTLETSNTIPTGTDVFDQIYSEKDGVVYASLPLIYTLISKNYTEDKYSSIKNKLL